MNLEYRHLDFLAIATVYDPLVQMFIIWQLDILNLSLQAQEWAHYQQMEHVAR